MLREFYVECNVLHSDIKDMFNFNEMLFMLTDIPLTGLKVIKNMFFGQTP